MLRNEGDPLRTVMVSTPGPAYFRVTDLEAHNMNEVPDADVARRQHAELVRLMAGAGVRVVDVPELAHHPNSTFTRDVALCTPAGYIGLRMGLPSRRAEPRRMARALDALGEPRAGSIEAPGTVEGGDVALAGDVAFVGLSSRTNAEGVRQLAALLGPMGFEVRVNRVPGRFLHAGGAMSLIGPRKVVATAGVFDKACFEGFEVIEVPDRGPAPSAGNVICLREDEVIANVAEDLPSIEILEAAGVRVHRLDLSEFRKGAGGPSCLILPVERG